MSRLDAIRRKLLRKYVGRLPTRQQEIRAAVDAFLAGDPEAAGRLRTIGHQVKGTGASFGFERLTELGAALEAAPDDQLVERARELATEMRRAIRVSLEGWRAEDETPEARAERGLALQRFFDLSLDLLCTATFEGYFVQLNPAWEEVLGWTLEELRARPFIDFVHPDDLERTQAEAARLSEQSTVAISFENRYRRKDGTYAWLRWTSTTDPDRKLLLALARDITEEKARETELRRAKDEAELANRTKSEFLATMSHELRTPLNSVIGFSRLLLRRAQLDAKSTDYLERIRDNGLQLLGLINDILDLSKIEAGRMELVFEKVDLAQLAEDVAASLRGGASHVELVVDIESVVFARTDSGRLRQVLVNLVGNAIKFTETGDVRVWVGYDDEGARIDVTDSGVGIAPERLATIFEAFRQVDTSISRQFGGTGLGLTLSRSFCEHLGLELDVASTLGVGSTFTVRFPAATLV